MTNAPTFLPLTESDAGELLVLQRAAYITEAQINDDAHMPPLTETLDEIRGVLRDSAITVLGLRMDGRLVASGRMSLRQSNIGSAAYLSRLCVAPDMQGMGLGKALLKALEEHTPSSASAFELATGANSITNLSLYGKNGYSEYERITLPAGYDEVHLRKLR